MFSYQCSQLSTPESVIEVFNTAKRFQKNQDTTKYVSVVVLDEVGLAEDSPNLPLKALHPLLEDGTEGADDSQEVNTFHFFLSVFIIVHVCMSVYGGKVLGWEFGCVCSFACEAILLVHNCILNLLYKGFCHNCMTDLWLVYIISIRSLTERREWRSLVSPTGPWIQPR